jgi:hypothetical protein
MRWTDAGFIGILRERLDGCLAEGRRGGRDAGT